MTTPIAPSESPTATRAVLATNVIDVPTATAVPSMAPTATATVQGWETQVALLTSIPGAMPAPTRSGGLAEPSSFVFQPIEGDTVQELQLEVIRLLGVLSQKTGPQPGQDLETQIRQVMVPTDGLEWRRDELTCDVEDTVKFFKPVEQPSFGPPYSLWLEGVDKATIIWNFAGDSTRAQPSVEVIYDGWRDLLYAVIGVNAPGARIMVHTFTDDSASPTEQDVRGAVYFRLVDGQWRIALTSIGCQYRIQ